MRNAVTLWSILALALNLSFSQTLQAQELAPPPSPGAVLGLVQPASSRALQRFQKRPVSELSKLIYLVDRLGETKVDVVYEKKSYSSQLVLPVARWYLTAHYNKKDSAENWLSKWCYRSLGSGETVWVKYQDGSLREARDLLLEELDRLDSLCETNPAL